MPRAVRLALAALSALLITTTAYAQEPPAAPPQPPAIPPLVEKPIDRFVFDARGVLARFKSDATTASALGVASDDLPTRGLGLTVGGHVYPLRTRNFALGLGAELLLRARGSSTVPPAVADGPDGPTVVTRMTALSPQLSLNFGKRNGWSYLSGGLGWGSLTTELDDSPLEDPDSRPKTLNYGGGARWFAKKHLAFSLDLRFYSVNQQEATADRPAFPKMRIMVFSAGISVR